MRAIITSALASPAVIENQLAFPIGSIMTPVPLTDKLLRVWHQPKNRAFLANHLELLFSRYKEEVVLFNFLIARLKGK